MYSSYRSPPPRGGLHSFAVMKILAKWVLDKCKEVSEQVACTSKPCLWSVPKSRDRMVKSQIMEISVISPATAKKRNADESAENVTTKQKPRKGIECILYDPRTTNQRKVDFNAAQIILNNLREENPHTPALSVVNQNMINLSTVETQFGKMPVGSLLSIQCALIPPDFSVYCNVKLGISSPSPICYLSTVTLGY